MSATAYKYFASHIVFAYFNLFETVLGNYSPDLIINKLKPAFEHQGRVYFYLLEERLNRPWDNAVYLEVMTALRDEYLPIRNKLNVLNRWECSNPADEVGKLIDNKLQVQYWINVGSTIQEDFLTFDLTKATKEQIEQEMSEVSEMLNKLALT